MFLFSLAFLIPITFVNAEDSLNLESESAILIDYASGKVLYEKMQMQSFQWLV